MAAIASTMLSTKKFPVGITHLTLRISNLREPPRGFEQKLIVDTGALHSIVPATLLAEVGIEPDRSQTFELADGRRVQREVGGHCTSWRGFVPRRRSSSESVRTRRFLAR